MLVPKVRVSVRFFTSLRELVGKKDETLELPGSEKITLDELLTNLSSKHGKGFAEYIYDEKTGEVKKFLQFLINVKSSSSINGFKTELKEGEVLTILPPVSGG